MKTTPNNIEPIKEKLDDKIKALNSSRVYKKVTPKGDLSWYIKWASSIILIIAMLFTSANMFPINLWIANLGFIGWFASGLSRVKGSIIYILMLGVSLFLLLVSAFCFLYMANFDDPAISLSKTLDEMVKMEYNKNDNIAKVSQ